ncbi:hypothetical protein [Thermodesulforhabdus norvegica]|uniref:Uncharacterized protein n=1 Tax=Thermodesulforhabdus norvegica TaxID=39841 RepID=A0A1I4UBR5_9BACT|nr:hypothetical protein [Thermodesulforhabdus norvegica]SFM86153.1 hypothetical protein SAMN05660836_01756 [Thermodesulforhabdus norvegica]
MVKCGVIFCGGCNPLINRSELFRCIKRAFSTWNFSYLHPEGPPEVDLLLIINGCPAGCIRPEEPKRPALIVSGTLVNQRQVPEKGLCEIVCKELQRLAREKNHAEVERRIQKETQNPG